MVSHLSARGVVVAPQPRAAEAGIEMLQEGGNAVDAAIATAFAQAVVDPLNTSIGGFGCFHCYDARSGSTHVISFHGRAPLAARPGIFAYIADGADDPLSAGTYQVRDDANQLGYLAPTVPGSVKGFAEALERFGTMPLSRVVQPAVRLAAEGWRVTPEDYADWTRPTPPGRLDALTRFTATPATAAIYTNHGGLWRVGERIVNGDYARTLERMGAGGAQAFYTGEIAAEIVADFARNGGLISGEDLAAYTTDTTAGYRIDYRGYTIASAPAPASGLVVLEILNILEGYDLSAIEPSSPEYIHLLAEAMRIAFSDMSRYLGDPDLVEIPVERLLSKAYAEECRSRIDPRRRSAELGSAPAAPPEHPDTTQVTTMDVQGNAVTMTHSLGAASGVVTPGLGFIFNGQMHRFHPLPGYPNSIAPRKRRVTGMSPTIVLRQGRPLLVLGAPGGQGIVHGVVQAILNVLDHGMSAADAVSVPRIHCQREIVDLEWRTPARVAAALEQMGHKVNHSVYAYDRSSGRVHAVLADPATGKLTGGADPRAGGVALYG